MGINVKTTKQDITIKQGTTFQLVLAALDDADVAVDLSVGFTARMQGRVTKPAAATVLDIDTVGGEITLGNGTITIDLTSAETEALDFANAVYDLEVEETSGTNVDRAFYGALILDKEVTRP